MSDLMIGLSGLNVARKAMEVIGNNIANASTEGYHRQELVVEPVRAAGVSNVSVGRGAEATGIRRLMDPILDREIRRQHPDLGQVAQELATLTSLENILGTLSGEGLTTAMNRFFGALRELASQPENPALRGAAVWAADVLAAQFNTTGDAIVGLQDHVLREAQTTAGEINGLATQIADLNGRIEALFAQGVTDNTLLDQRDQALTALAELADITVNDGEYGSVTVRVWGTVAVLRNRVTEIEVDYAGEDLIGVSAAGASNYESGLRGGKLGGLLALRNEILPDVADRLDILAHEVAHGVNRRHVQGVGTAGSFTELIGWGLAEGTLDGWDPPVAAGALRLRVTDTATGDITRHTLAIDPATQDRDDLVALFDAVPNLSAELTRDRLRITADAGFTFDFLPAVGPAPATSAVMGTAEVTVGGNYTGASNQVITCTVVGTGQVGVTDGLTLRVTDAGGNVLKEAVVGLGYAEGDPIVLEDGLRVAIGRGTLNAGDTFTIDALADSDPSDLLAAAGINCLFEGTTARTLGVAAGLREDAAGLATSLSGTGLDNLNAARMADVADADVAALGDMTLTEGLTRLVTDVGQWVSIREARYEGLAALVSQFKSQRDDISGVDINDEAARLLLYEQMFQGMAKYLTVCQRAYDYMMAIL